MATAKKLISVKFIKSPTGTLKLAYNAGESGKVTKEQYDILAEAGFIEVKDKK